MDEAAGKVQADFTMLPATCATQPGGLFFINTIKRIDTVVPRGKAYSVAAPANTIQASRAEQGSYTTAKVNHA